MRRRAARFRITVGLAALALVLLAARAALPYWLRSYVDGVLDRTKGYAGSVADIDVSLLRGAYQIDGVEIHKEGGKAPVPLFSADQIDLSIEWRALLDGSLVGEVELLRPRLDVVVGPTPAHTQTGAEVNWAHRLEKLFPFDFDRFAVVDGQLHFQDPYREPPVDVALRDVDGEARNLTNSRELSARRPAHVSFHARAQRSGRAAGELEIDPFAARPDFRLKLELVSLQLPELDDFLRAYAGVDAERGQLDVYSEVVSRDGRFDGWVEPLLRDLDVLRVEEEATQQNPLATLWEALVGIAAELLENQSEDQLAARIPLSGSYEQPDLGVWGAFVSLVRNGYVEALKPRVELLRQGAREQKG
jgi:hypothetical protein